MQYFISDTHFGDKVVLRNERTQFQTIEEHDDFIVTSVNKIVKMTDELWILGDLGRNIDYVKKLNGRKILLLGNHDNRSMKEYLGYFAEVYKYPVYLSKNFLLSHVPEPVPPHVLNVHGHLHASYLDSNQHFNISLHMIDYKPVSETRLKQEREKRQLPKENIKFLEEWYADKYVFTDKSRTDVVMNNLGKINLNKSIKLKQEKFK